MTDIIHGSSQTVPVDNPFFRWWQSVDQWTLVATFGLIVMGLLLSMAASVPLADIFIHHKLVSCTKIWNSRFFFSIYRTYTSSHFWYGFRKRGSAMVLFKLVNNSAV